MAAFTSSQSGNYSDPATWGQASTYPGSTTAQADTFTISAGHIITLDITTFAGTVGNVSIAATGTLLIAANFNTASKFTGGAWTVEGTVTFKNDAAGTYCLALYQSVIMTIKSGGKLEMVSESDPTIKHRLYLSAGSVSGTTYVITESGAIVDIRGYAGKTQKTYTTAAVESAATSVTVNDATGWAVGDLIILQYGKSSLVKTITSGSGLTWSWSGGATVTYPEQITVYNMSKNVELWNNNQARTCRIQIADGTTATIKHCSFTAFLMNQILGKGTYENICIYTNGGTALDVRGTAITIKNSIIYLYAASSTNTYVSGENCILDGVEAIAPNTTNTVGIRLLNSGILRNFVAVGVTAISVSSSGKMIFVNGKIFDATTGILSANYESYYAANLDFGLDEFENALANGTDLSLGYASGYFDNCSFSASTLEVGTPSSDGNFIVLSNYDKQSGFRKEYQKYGYIESNTAEARSGYCLVADPSSTANPMKMKFSFPCASSKTPQVKFWLKKSGTLGDVEVFLGGATAGIKNVLKSSGSVDASGKLSPTDSWVQYTVNFDTSSTIAGEVEVIINILDSSSGLLYIDDITVSGNL